MTRNYIKFDNDHVEEILEGDKYQTVRYGWDDWPTVGNLVDLRDGDGDVFAEAEIEDVHRETIHHFCQYDHHGHRNYDDPEEMVEHLDEYYSDDMDRSTIITTITFNINSY